MSRRKTIKKPQELSLLITYCLQKLGQASVNQLYDAFEDPDSALRRLGVKVSLNNVRATCEALRARGIVSKNHAAVDGEGAGSKVEVYSMRRAAFIAPPEVARFTKILPDLIKTGTAEVLKGVLDADENSENPAETKGAGKSRNHYRGFQIYLITLETMQPWVGGQPIEGNPALERLYAGSPFQPPGVRTKPVTKKVAKRGDDADTALGKRLGKKGEWLDYGVDLVFERAADGRLFVNAGVVRGWLSSTTYALGFSSEGIRVQIGSPGIYITPDGGVLEVEQRPINCGGDGHGMARYEVLPAGQIVTFTVRVPTEGAKAPSEDQWAKALAWGARYAPRSLSPARNRMTGASRLVSIDRVGDIVVPTIGVVPPGVLLSEGGVGIA